METRRKTLMFAVFIQLSFGVVPLYAAANPYSEDDWVIAITVDGSTDPQNLIYDPDGYAVDASGSCTIDGVTVDITDDLTGSATTIGKVTLPGSYTLNAAYGDKSPVIIPVSTYRIHPVSRS